MFTQHLDERSFDPETLKCMGIAFEAACYRLGLTDKTDPLRPMVAETVIAFAHRGDNDPIALCERALSNMPCGPGAEQVPGP